MMLYFDQCWLGVVLGLNAYRVVALATPQHLPIVDLEYAVHQATISVSNNPSMSLWRLQLTQTKETGNYYNFSNIRYGDTIDGANRFQAPRPPRTTNRTLNTGQVATRCPQTHPFWLSDGTAIAQGIPADQLQPIQFNISQIPPKNSEETEDCLFLDVMVPAKIFHSSNLHKQHSKCPENTPSGAAGAPVLVWIDGGGFSAGYKHEQPSSGLVSRSQMVDDKGVIFVAMNYRVGLFGFLPAAIVGKGDSNVGLLDQRLALDWVHRYIHLFGGDPSRVTIMGESAGGGSVLHQITAYGGSVPVSFQQAILQSPGFQPNGNPGFQEQLINYALTNASVLTNKTVETVDDLRSLSFDEITLLNSVIIGRSPYGTYTFGPVVDGTFVPDLPSKMIAQGLFAKSLNGLMMGTNFNEGVLFDSPFLQNDSDYRGNVRLFFPNATEEVVNYIANDLYPDDLSGKYNYSTQPLRAALTTAEGCFLCNTRYLSQALPNIVSTRIYKYLFAVPPAIHADDIGYTFYYGKGSLTWEGFPVNEMVALALQDYIASFTITGSPSNGTAIGLHPVFPAYGNDASVLVLNETNLGEVITDPQANTRCDWWQKSLYF